DLGQKLSISKLLPFQGDFVVFILKPRALPWARSFCPFRAYGMWLMTPPPYNVNVLWAQSYIKNMFYQNLFGENMSFYQNLFL
ncbi:hypothetical protein AAAT87_13950, partial [Segatella sinensis]